VVVVAGSQALAPWYFLATPIMNDRLRLVLMTGLLCGVVIVTAGTAASAQDSTPRLVARMRIDPAMPGSAAQIGVVLQRAPRVMSFLQCDAVSADESRRAYFARMCLETIGVEK